MFRLICQTVVLVLAVVIMHIANTSVVSSKCTVLNWTILKVEEEMHSFNDFFSFTVASRIGDQKSRCRLLSAHVGPDKNSLDAVDLNLNVIHVISLFGKFVKYFVEDEFAADYESEVVDIAGQESLENNSSCMYVEPVRQRNKKDKLYNDLTDLLKKYNASFRDDEVHLGKQLVTTLRDILWHIDGHHYVLAQRATAVPEFFSSFTKYNMPELSKHRKRVTRNISSDQLQDFVLDLINILENSYWDRLPWKDLKTHFLLLCDCLTNYVDYLHQKNKKMKLVHRSPTPVRAFGNNLKMTFIQKVSSPVNLSFHTAVNESLNNKPCYEFVNISDLLPPDSVKKHRALHGLISSGLSFSCILLVYSPGSNIGNLQFLWKIPEDTDPSTCFQTSQTTVEDIKKIIPIYHTRAMRKALFNKFGRVSPSTKPASLRYFYKELTGQFIAV